MQGTLQTFMMLKSATWDVGALSTWFSPAALLSPADLTDAKNKATLQHLVCAYVRACVDLKANSGVCPLVILAFHVIHNGSESQGFLTLCVSAQTSNCHSAWQASSRGKCIMNDNMSASRGLRKSLQVYTHTWFSWVEKVLGKKATNILTQRVLWDFHSLS